MGELGSLEEHLTSTCDYNSLPCPNSCQFQIIRKHLKHHLQYECLKRQYSCRNCGVKGTFDKITTEHLRQCPNALVKCPKTGCMYVCKRSDCKLHKCLHDQVLCKYSDIGCRERRLRKDMEAHEQDSVHHLHLTTEMAIQLQQEMAVLKEENEILAVETREEGEAIEGNDEAIGTLCQHSEQNTEELRFAGSRIEQLQRESAEVKQKIASLQSFTTNQRKVTFRLFPYSAHKETDTQFNSDPFYLSIYGYKFNIQVYANGGRSARGTHVSVYASLLKGDNDNSLTWPFTGTFVIELLNQLEDKNHHVLHIKFPAGSQSNKRVVGKKQTHPGYGYHEFIAHSNLAYKSNKNTQYLKYDMLIFRVSVEVPGFKPWLEI